MGSINRSSRKTICSICGAIILWAIGAYAAALPPETDNAALLYYQALLSYPQPEPDWNLIYNVTIDGADPNEQTRKYLNLSCQNTIELIQAATQLSKCDWGLLYSRGNGISLEFLTRSRQLCDILDCYARTLAADGKYKQALDVCLRIRRFASRIGDDTFVMFSVSLTNDAKALRCIQHVLGSMPPDVEILTWLKGQLAAVQVTPRWFTKVMKMNRDLKLQFWRLHPDGSTLMVPSFNTEREMFLECMEDESTKKEILSLTNEELLARASQSYDKFLDSAVKIIESDMSFEQKCTELSEISQFSKCFKSGDPIYFFRHDEIDRYYKIMVSSINHFNAMTAAVEIYLVKARTGQLPEKLPDGLPKDPFSGEDFEYEITKDGFVLRCRVKDLLEGKVSHKVLQHEFKVQR